MSTSSTEPETDSDSSDNATSMSEGERNHMCLRSGRKVPLKRNANYASTLLLPSKFQKTTHQQHQQETCLARGKLKQKVSLSSIHNTKLHSLRRVIVASFRATRQRRQSQLQSHLGASHE